MATPALAPVRPGVPQLHEIGATGLDLLGGQIYEELHRDLRGLKAMRRYREMVDNCAPVGSFRLLLESLIGQVEWLIRPPRGKDSPAHLEAADFAESCRRDLGGGWRAFVLSAVEVDLYGFGLWEVWHKLRLGDQPQGEFADTYERDRHRSGYADGRVGWGGFEPRAQDSVSRWTSDASGRAVGFEQSTRAGRVVVPFSKSVHLRFRAPKGSPEGYSLLRPCYPTWHRLSHFWELLSTGVERDLAGLPVLEVPERITLDVATTEEREQYEAAKLMVQRVRRNQYEGVVMPSETSEAGTPSGWRLRLLSSGGARQHDVVALTARLEERILKTLLSQVIDTGSQGQGSYALSDTHQSINAFFAYSRLDAIKDEFDRVQIPRLMELNGFPREVWPELTYTEIDTPDLTHIANYLAQLKGAGLLTAGPELERWVRERADLPPRSEVGPEVEEPEAVPADDVEP